MALWEAYLDARKGKRKTRDEFVFEVAAVGNIKELATDILNRTYKPSRGIAFVSHNPVDREIFAAPFRDRVVHHFLYNLSVNFLEKDMIYDSYSCRIGKGTLLGAKRLRKFMNLAREEYREPIFIIKMDIKGYFMSLPRKKLFSLIDQKLRKQMGKVDGKFPRKYYITRFLWKEVIFDDPTVGVKRRGTAKEWDNLPSSKSLFCQPPGIGIVIGNLSSQLLSNVYLTQFDRYVKDTLRCKYYGRYVDDFYILTPKSQLKQGLATMEQMRCFLRGLGLQLHPNKLYVQDVERGVTFLGVRVYPNRLLPGKRLVHNYYKAAAQVASGNKDIATVISMMGHMTHYKSDKIQSKIFDSVGWSWRFQGLVSGFSGEI